MERKKAVASASLLMVLLASFALVPPASSSPDPEEHRYVVMEGTTTSHAELAGSVTTTVSFSTPLLGGLNITFSDPDPVTGVVDLTVPAESYDQGAVSYEYDPIVGWIRIVITYPIDGSGWLFTGTGTSPLLGDVDCYTFNNNTGVYWDAPGNPYGFNGSLAAAPGQFPSPGPDGVAGTGDDGFGDGTPDPIGSSILYLMSTVDTQRWDGTNWVSFFSYNWTGVWTTGVAYDIVIEPTSGLDGANSTEVGHPWEFLAGIEHPPGVSHGHPKWNAYVTYATSWSTFGIDTWMGTLNIMVEETQKHVREDCIIADINCDEIVDIFDIVICAAAFGAKDVKFPDRTEADPNWDPRADLMSERGVIDIFDLVRIAGDFGAKLTKDCIIRP